MSTSEGLKFLLLFLQDPSQIMEQIKQELSALPEEQRADRIHEIRVLLCQIIAEMSLLLQLERSGQGKVLQALHLLVDVSNSDYPNSTEITPL